MGSAKCSAESSRSGARFGNAWAIEMALKEMSMAPAFAATAPTYLSTACSSRTSTCAASATPPAADDVGCNRFYLGKVASTQKELCTLASECARDSAANIPSGSVDQRNLVLQDHLAPLGSIVHSLRYRRRTGIEFIG